MAAPDVEFIEEPRIPPKRSSDSVYPKPEAWASGGAMVGQLIVLWGPMFMGFCIGCLEGRAGEVNQILHGAQLPMAAVGTALCADFAQRCFHERESESTRPRVASVLSCLLWTAMAWVCAFALGRAIF